MNVGTCIRSPLALAKPRAPLRAWKEPNFTNFVSCLQLAALAGDLPSSSIEQGRESIEETASALGQVKTFATFISGDIFPSPDNLLLKQVLQQRRGGVPGLLCPAATFQALLFPCSA